MEPDRCFSVTGQRELQQQTTLLASIEPSDAPFLSCYFDLGEGLAHCREAFEQKVRQLREGLAGRSRVDFDHAVELIRSGLHSMPAEARSVALFSRGRSGGQFFLSLPLSAAVEERVTLYRTPDIFPLVKLDSNREHFLLVLFRPSWVQLSEVINGVDSIKVWSALPNARHAGGPSRWHEREHRPVSRLKPLHNIERFIRLHRNLPVVVAGEIDPMDEMCSQLRSSLCDRLVETVPLDPAIRYRDSVSMAMRSFRNIRERKSKQLADHMIYHRPGARAVVTGIQASLIALRNAQVETMVVIDEPARQPGWSCARCGAVHVHERAPAICSECNHADVHAYEAQTELIRLAVQQEIDVRIIGGDNDLRYLGGVGCRLCQRLQPRHLQTAVSQDPLNLVA